MEISCSAWTSDPAAAVHLHTCGEGRWRLLWSFCHSAARLLAKRRRLRRLGTAAAMVMAVMATWRFGTSSQRGRRPGAAAPGCSATYRMAGWPLRPSRPFGLRPRCGVAVAGLAALDFVLYPDCTVPSERMDLPRKMTSKAAMRRSQSFTKSFSFMGPAGR